MTNHLRSGALLALKPYAWAFIIDRILRLKPYLVLIGPVELVHNSFFFLENWRLFTGDFCECCVSSILHLKVSILNDHRLDTILLNRGIISLT